MLKEIIKEVVKSSVVWVLGLIATSVGAAWSLDAFREWLFATVTMPRLYLLVIGGAYVAFFVFAALVYWLFVRRESVRRQQADMERQQLELKLTEAEEKLSAAEQRIKDHDAINATLLHQTATPNRKEKVKPEHEGPLQEAATARGISHEAIDASLSAALALERFAQLCADRIKQAETAEDEAAREHSHDPLGQIKFPEFAYPLSIEWKWLDANDMAKLKAFEVAVEGSARHVRSMAQDTWIDPFDYVGTITRESAKLGKKAWTLAAETRQAFGIPAAELGEHDAELHEILDRRIKQYESAQEDVEKLSS